MNKLKILVSPNPLLKQVSKQVRFPLDQQTQSNIKHLKNTFRDSFTQCQTRTLGLAAPQIGILQRFFIMPNNMNYPDVSLNVLKSIVRKFNVYINPQILEKSQNQVKIVEQCLSIGSKIYYDVERSQSIRVLYFNHRGQSIEQNLTGIKARVFLHQYDHLNGVTMDQRGNLIKRNNSVDQQLHMAIRQDSELFEQKSKQKL